MRRPQHGFTLIEQVMATATFGTLMATALPSFVDLRADAESASIKSITSTAASAMYVNLGGCIVTQHKPTPGKCRPVKDCADLAQLMVGGEMPAGYTVTPRTLGGPGDNGNEGQCIITQATSGDSAPFVGIAAGN